MSEQRETSHPPSEPLPLPARTKLEPTPDVSDRPVRIQLVGAMLLGLLLVAAGLYLWRRPRAVASDGAPVESSSVLEVASAQVSSPDGGVALAVAQLESVAQANGLTLTDPRVVECHDRGSKRTAAADCDHLAAVEDALTKAIEDSASCVPETAGGGTIEYVADVSFARKRNPVSVALPKDGRSLRSAKALAQCRAAVAKQVHELALDGVTHAHQRYKIAVTATYPSGAPTGARAASPRANATDTDR